MVASKRDALAFLSLAEPFFADYAATKNWLVYAFSFASYIFTGPINRERHRNK
jgi:hypothetical protein